MEILSSTYFQNGEGFAFEQDGGSSFETNTLEKKIMKRLKKEMVRE